MSYGGEALALRREAEVLRANLRRLEQQDWPRWLREADGVTREIAELLRQAAELEREARARGSARSYDSMRHGPPGVSP